MSEICKCGHSRFQHDCGAGCIAILEDGSFCPCQLTPQAVWAGAAIPPKPSPEPPSETILQEAQRLVSGERGAAYGHPKEDFGRAAAIFNAITGERLDAADIAYVLLAVKLSRQQHAGKRDNLVDAAGYLACLARVEGWDA